jgi:HEAT repeat protein
MKKSYGEFVGMLSTAEGWTEAYPELLAAGEAAIPDVIAGLADRDPKIRKWCAAFFDHHARREAVPAMIRALDDPSAEVRRHTVHAIGCQPCKPDPLLVDVVAQLIRKAAEDESIRVRRAAVHLLGLQTHDFRIISVLEKILKSEADRKLLSNAQFALAEQSREDRRDTRRGRKSAGCLPTPRDSKADDFQSVGHRTRPIDFPSTHTDTVRTQKQNRRSP